MMGFPCYKVPDQLDDILADFVSTREPHSPKTLEVDKSSRRQNSTESISMAGAKN
jgi:hypothetical protein